MIIQQVSNYNSTQLCELIKLLADSITTGASVGFIHPVNEEVSINYWKSQLQEPTLDTQTDYIAKKFYIKLGWQEVGEIPNYTKFSDGVLQATSYYYKILLSLKTNPEP